MSNDLEWLGHGNSLPPNFTEVTEREWWNFFCRNNHVAIRVNRYMHNKDVVKGHPCWGKHITIYVDQFSKTGYGYVDTWDIIDGLEHMKPKFFFKTAVCFHKMVEDNSYRGGRCMHLYRCSNEGCDHSFTVDSSD